MGKEQLKKDMANNHPTTYAEMKADTRVARLRTLEAEIRRLKVELGQTRRRLPGRIQLGAAFEREMQLTAKQALKEQLKKDMANNHPTTYKEMKADTRVARLRTLEAEIQALKVELGQTRRRLPGRIQLGAGFQREMQL